MCNWLKSLFGKKCHCEGGCCGDKKVDATLTPESNAKEETVITETALKEEVKA